MRRFATVILVDRRGWVLLQERDEHAPIDPERWGLVGGHVEPGEDFETAAYRELAEETGLTPPPGALDLWQELTVHDVDTMAVYAGATSVTDADIVLGEGRRIVFVDPMAAPALDLSSAARVVVPAFLASSAYGSLLP